MSDAWTNIRGRSLINFLVNNPKGTVFLKTIDASNMVKDADLIFHLIDVVEEVGEDIVVQVVTDNASAYKAAGRLLMEKRKHLYWTPCAAYCIDLILKDLGKLNEHKKALFKANKVSNYIYNHGWILALMKEHTKCEIIRPATTRFATAFLTLQSIYQSKDALEMMFVSDKWKSSTYFKKKEGKEIKHIVLQDKYFWPSVVYAIKTTQPLVNV
ncbi:hypothetical protein Dsin_028060 [Dipteronia sinensis]|uniref:DUF659 domain-containing protein n=1 Tax=Dipteronia sinensis TaxID=43782 RepID=A0AAE0DU79_9ROSI|nr:hypothetical protein Dsin_028060 [Dipteronia sinensis]